MTGTELVLLIGAFLTGAAGMVTAMTAARKSQLEALVEVVNVLQADNTRIISENKRLLERVDHLECELEERDGTLEQVKRWVETLVNTLKANNIPIPPMPEREKTKPR